MISSTRALLHLHNSLNKVFKGNAHQLMPCVWITPLPIPCLWTNKRRPLFFAQISHSGWLLAGHSQHKCFLLTLLTTANSPLAPSWKPCWAAVLPGKEKVKSSSVIYCLASFVVSIFTLFVCCFVGFFFFLLPWAALAQILPAQPQILVTLVNWNRQGTDILFASP